VVPEKYESRPLDSLPDWWWEVLVGFSDKTRAYPEVFQSIPEVSDRYAVLVETRRHPALEPVLRNVMFYLAPKGWGLVVMHGGHNKALLEEITQGWSHVHLRQLDTDHLANHDGHLPVKHYSDMLATREFWEVGARGGDGWGGMGGRGGRVCCDL
jgi:hypothetical protein